MSNQTFPGEFPPQGPGIGSAPRATIAVTRQGRPKQRAPVWRVTVTSGTHTVFDSQWVSITIIDESGARWLAEVIRSLSELGAFVPPPGHRRSEDDHFFSWSGNPSDDSVGEALGYSAHAEHMSGPLGRKGGTWWCAVYVPPANRRIFDSGDPSHLRPRSGRSARWLCEIVASAHSRDVLPSTSGADQKLSERMQSSSLNDRQ